VSIFYYRSDFLQNQSVAHFQKIHFALHRSHSHCHASESELAGGATVCAGDISHCFIIKNVAPLFRPIPRGEYSGAVAHFNPLQVAAGDSL
jgi:hypothetical protein